MINKIKTTVIGAAGKMGREIISLISTSKTLELVGALESKDSAFLGKDACELAGNNSNGVTITDNVIDELLKSEAVIDFSSPVSTVFASEISAQGRLVHVIGTTGFNADQLELINLAARHATIIKSGNMSLGVNALLGLVERISGLLDDDWDAEINELHHKDKADSPSGTALALGEAIAKGRDQDLKKVKEQARDGINLNRKKGSIGFSSVRGGSIVGEHSVIFAGSGERIRLEHIAETRDIFAKGAIKAVQWGIGKSPGLYTMQDVLGI